MNQGSIVQCIGAVVDVEFARTEMPKIYDALKMDEIGLTAEVVRLTHWNEVDVVDLRHADPLTAMEVARSGLLLFARDPSDFTEFRSLAFRRYVDSEKLRRAQRDALDRFEQRHEPR